MVIGRALSGYAEGYAGGKRVRTLVSTRPMTMGSGLCQTREPRRASGMLVLSLYCSPAVAFKLTALLVE
eukprot:3264139-Prymnesium_polylepis.2